MNQKSINSLNMIQTTQLCLDKNKTIFKDVASLVRASAEVTRIVVAILAAQREQAAKDGLAAEKAAAKITLIDQAHNIASLAHACADENLLSAIAVRTDLSITDVQAGNEGEFVDRCKGILADAQELVDEVDDCEITAAQTKSLDNAIKGFESVKPKPRVGVADGKSATQRIPVLVRKGSALLRKRIDRLMVQFKTSNPEFYGAYKAARKTVNQAATHDKSKIAKLKKNDASGSGTSKAA